ncbi:MAG: hypothetical protein O3B37_04605 [Proteobacteria bacterium]|nr:hypothetical protein [Pseudomonadota bacterium]
MNIVRFESVPWEDRVNVDNWPCKTRTLYDNQDTGLSMRMVNYPVGSTEPRHVHAGMHAATVVRNRAIVDGVTLRPLDVLVGPSNEPHGPIEYPEGCWLLSAFQGSNHHSEVENLSEEKFYKLVLQKEIPWRPGSDGGQYKTLVDRGLGQLLVEAVRLKAGEQIKPAFLAALLIEGDVSVGDEKLDVWDYVYADDGEPRADLVCTSDATMLAWTMRDLDS